MFLHEATQSMAMTAQASSTPYNPQTLNLPSISALVSFYHACLGFPVKQTWLNAIKAGNCNTFDGLTFSNVARYCPDANKTILGHLAQRHQNVRSTKPELPPPLAPPAPVMPMEITFMDMEDNHKKYGTLRSLKYIYSNPFRFPISSLGLPIFFLRKAERKRWQNVLPTTAHQTDKTVI